MSRYTNYKRKQFLQSILFYVILTILFFVFFFTFGLRILLNASAFIANFSANKSSPTTQEEVGFFGTFEIDRIPTATNSAQINISGSVNNFDWLEFFVNGEKVKEKKVTSLNSFDEQIGDLNLGNNEIYIKAKATDVKKIKNSTKYSVLYKSNKPKLEISEPQDNSKTSKTEISLIGMTDKETFVKVNDYPAVVDVEGKFQTSVKLKEGENKITILVADIAGNTDTKTLSVIYEKE